MHLEIGTEKAKNIVVDLTRLLSDNEHIHQETRSFYWNVSGPMFLSLRTLFDEQRQGLLRAADQLAERIRALGFPVEFAPEASQAAGGSKAGGAREMIQALLKSNERAQHTAGVLAVAASEARDFSTAKLAAEMLHFHEVSALSLRSLLEE